MMRPFFALVFVCAMTGFGKTAQADPRLISVSGTAEKSVPPDLISFSLEIWARSAAAQRTQTLAADETKRVMKILENYKIGKEDIQTESFQFGPDYVWDQTVNKNKLNGFSSAQVLRVLLRKTSEAGRLIDAMTVAEKGDAGPRREFGTNVSGIQWDSTARKSVEGEVLGMAVKDARSKADAMAKAAGVKIKNVHRLSHQAMVDPGPRPMMSKMALAAADSASTELAGGEIKLHVTVSADYEIQ
ncbi:MAG TPA: SIMPL domain-containing protein [Pseudobdellovibrionaceae bacterium]|nr:SIMPL domain-containing protein [Pseudobdellovibrionaceae bacterium]